MNLVSRVEAMVTSLMDTKEGILEWENFWKSRVSLHWRNYIEEIKSPVK